jgi:ubiquitin-like protein Pup
MSDRVRKSAKSDTSDQATQGTKASTSLAEKGEDIKQAIDELLDEIDGVLEDNAEEFVAGYVQRGGE